jgi:hypothetical protein
LSVYANNIGKQINMVMEYILRHIHNQLINWPLLPILETGAEMAFTLHSHDCEGERNIKEE